MVRWIAIAATLVAGYFVATVAFAGDTSPRGEDPLCPPFCVLTTTTETTTTTTTTTTTGTQPPPTGTTPTTTTTTPPSEPPPDENAPEVGDKPRQPGKTQADGTRIARMSDERTYTTWAPYRKAARVFSKPFGKGRGVASLHRLTADNLPEVYVVLKQATRGSKTPWLQVRVPVRPNGTVGWVRRDALGTFRRVTTQIVIDRRRFRLSLYDKGRLRKTFRVGVGRPGTVTPAGRFWVNERFKVQSAPAYGPYAIGTSAFSPTLTDWPGGGVVGIHGTDQPSLIPGRISHGCVRLNNADITRLVKLTPLGTPVLIK